MYLLSLPVFWRGFLCQRGFASEQVRIQLVKQAVEP